MFFVSILLCISPKPYFYTLSIGGNIIKRERERDRKSKGERERNEKKGFGKIT